ncbi:hypothetical protein GWI33_010642 [Rhynchophorus ferrugineus]|uniref:Uncharacterized protein n=1 Tax=Rhynchophorus ferrugineus TaxID=354439 RepID=A0A834MIU4_RHYFE|nr:hypothetical protein GWI33_010642 [Rhynchophorus ferrugineus]
MFADIICFSRYAHSKIKLSGIMLSFPAPGGLSLSSRKLLESNLFHSPTEKYTKKVRSESEKPQRRLCCAHKLDRRPREREASDGERERAARWVPENRN